MISNNTSVRWWGSQHCRIRRTSACRSRFTIATMNLHLMKQPSARCTSPHSYVSLLFPCLHFRMVHILLPAYSRHYSALLGAGLVAAADEMENHELEHLVLRERGVVWADQEEVGQQQKGEGSGVESQKTNETGNTGLHSDLAPVLSFSHLLYHQNSPCSKLLSSYNPVLYFCYC